MPLKMWLIIREVVVLPLVPVTATIGIREVAPGREQHVDDRLGDELRLADRRVGVHPEAGGGVDLADRAAGLADRLGDVGADEVDAGDVEADHPGRLLGDLDVLRVRLEGAVDRDATGRHVAGEGELHHLSLGRYVGHRVALLADQLDRGVVDLDPGQHLLVADAAARVGVRGVDQLLDGRGAVAGDRGGHPLGDRGDPAVDDQAAVVLADDQRLHDDHAAPGLLVGDRERRAHVVLVLEVEADAAAVVAVERLDHDRVADPLRRPDGLVGGAHGVLLRDREAGGAEQPGGEVLVGGDVDRDRGGRRGHRGADPLGVDALAELDQGVLVEPDPGDVPRDRLVEDRLGRGAERRALGAQDEVLELLVPVELRVGLDEVVDQAYGEARRPPARPARRRTRRPRCSGRADP